MNERSPKAILLTPPGAAALAVVRLTGTGVADFLSRHFSRPPAEGRCVHGTLADGDRVIDDPVVVLHRGRHVADVSLHGGPWVVRSVLELARCGGFEVVERTALPLPEEAVDAETEIGREVLRYLPMARTELALGVLLAQEAAWQRLPDSARVASILADRSLHWLLHPPRVAIVGEPNVGKSTLANQLFAQERSITADVPGTTRDWVGEIANIDGVPVMLYDTPGVRETGDAIEREAIRKARTLLAEVSVVLRVRDPFRDEPVELEGLSSECRVMTVVNQADLQREGERVSESSHALYTTATTGKGVGELRRAIRVALGCDDVDPATPRIWTHRQRDALTRALTDPAQLRNLLF